jgi:hypothetical protein
MEKSKFGLIFLYICFIFNGVGANYKSIIYEAYYSNQMQLWKDVIDQMNTVKPKNNEFYLELMNYQYGYIAWCIGTEKKEEAEKYLGLATENLKILEKNKYKLSMVNAYKSAFYGYRIGLNIWVAPIVGPKSMECAKLAINLDSNNALGYIQCGNVENYMPAFFGGSKTEALKYYLKAQKLMELHTSDMDKNWNYLSLLTTIAQVYIDMQDYKAACSYYVKILNIEPNYLWVKNDLYPKLLKKLKG